MEFDWGRNGTVDASTYLDFPEGRITLFYTPPTNSGSNYNFRLQPAVVNIAGGTEPYIGAVNEPYPWADDNDNDGIPDSTDPDDDNDGIPDNLDMFPKDPAENRDRDGDGVGDNADPDRDGDGVPNAQDKFPNNNQEWKDSDGDGVGDNHDSDDDNDGIFDGNDLQPTVPNKPAPGGGSGGSGDGDGGDATPINPGTPGTLDLGNLGAPGQLENPDKAFADSMSHVSLPGGIPDGIGDFAIDGLADDLKAAGTGMKSLLSGWQPFQTYVPSGDMTSFTADLGRFGSVIIPFPTEPASIGIFRGCCLFAVYWGGVMSVMRILKV
ncbi:thrombospondin type 3 repeat-containing protein [Luteolibacter soli]|uniref:Thrombospondin type 3 repeat-containing protein n=1 Tax=Luteolibacter soli TaxID=3135280 RepID=A0ABU9ARR6_9BACT